MKSMRIFTLLVLTAFLISCGEDEIGLLPTESETIKNLHAPQSGGQGQPISGAFAKFDFDTGAQTTSETDWDIAFRGTTIIVNGGTSQGTTDEPSRTSTAGVYIASGTMATVTEVDEDAFLSDTASGLAIPTGSDNGWYNYSGPPSYLITPLSGKILVIRTSDDKYAKMEILSYYKDAPANPDAFTDAGRYYTFNYVYQPNDGILSFD